MYEGYCLFCGEPLPDNSRRLYCSTKCRRDMQNERRRDERAEFKEAQDAAKARPMADPFSEEHIASLDWWEAAEVYDQNRLYPEPVQLETWYDRVQRAYRTLQDKELAKPQKMQQGWLM